MPVHLLFYSHNYLISQSCGSSTLHKSFRFVPRVSGNVHISMVNKSDLSDFDRTQDSGLVKVSTVIFGLTNRMLNEVMLWHVCMLCSVPDSQQCWLEGLLLPCCLLCNTSTPPALTSCMCIFMYATERQEGQIGRESVCVYQCVW